MNCKCGNEISKRSKTGLCDSCIRESRKKDFGSMLMAGEIKTLYSSSCIKGIKNFILKEQNYKCQICNLNNNWNDKELVFVLDHINGDTNNNTRENLRMICPNCDSQTDTFKSKNRGKGRDYDREYRRLKAKRK